MIEDIKHKLETKLYEIDQNSYVFDNVINILKTDHICDFQFNSNIRILPYEIVEKYGTRVLTNDKEFQRYYDQEVDPFFNDWRFNLEEYWKDKLKLLELYTEVPDVNISPMESFKLLAELIKKIERRVILLTPEVKPVTQKHPRLSGEQKEYDVLRSYWIDERGERKRLISRHIGDRHKNLEKEIACLFMDRGYGVLFNFNSDKGNRYDMVIERERMKSVVEIKSVTADAFNQLFLFDELLKRFAQDYPEET